MSTPVHLARGEIDTLLGLAAFYLQYGKPDAALPILRLVSEIDPTRIEILNLLAIFETDRSKGDEIARTVLCDDGAHPATLGSRLAKAILLCRMGLGRDALRVILGRG